MALNLFLRLLHHLGLGTTNLRGKRYYQSLPSDVYFFSFIYPLTFGLAQRSDFIYKLNDKKWLDWVLISKTELIILGVSRSLMTCSSLLAFLRWQFQCVVGVSFPYIRGYNSQSS